MKLAVFGGTFNPVHKGHLIAADFVQKNLGYDRIIFVPSGNPPHKKMEDCVSGEDRLNMLLAATEGDGRFLISDCEIKRQGASYTFDTVAFLMEKYASELEGKPGLIIGSDLFSGFHLWHRAKELSELCTLILLRRPVHVSTNAACGKYAELNEEQFDPEKEPLFKDAVFVMNPENEVSSSLVREKIRCGEDAESLVGKEVLGYIKRKGLYGFRQ
ncbi:MAG: nicotinate (nicotinamide) nucleotide adenylyltransferase [Treponema sp.]|nr:nicotinate (nicotinamide) nucleotide adenylyltransferase [Treponema sp.]